MHKPEIFFPPRSIFFVFLRVMGRFINIYSLYSDQAAYVRASGMKYNAHKDRRTWLQEEIDFYWFSDPHGSIRCYEWKKNRFWTVLQHLTPAQLTSHTVRHLFWSLNERVAVFSCFKMKTLPVFIYYCHEININKVWVWWELLQWCPVNRTDKK